MNRTDRIFDRLARTGIPMCSGRVPAFQACGAVGLFAAGTVATVLARATGLPYWLVAAIGASAVVVFLALVFACKVVTGEERIVYYHHEIACLFTAALVARTFHRPVLPCLDMAVLAIGTFLACGRIGCLMVGCCHGRPFRWGIRYREEHAEAGFPGYLVGVRLFPIQALESLCVLLIVAVGVLFVLERRPPGTALVWYTLAYGIARFLFEFARGDSARPYTLGFSQPQWLSVWLMSGAAVWELAVRALTPWHGLLILGVIAAMPVIAMRRNLDRSLRFRFLEPRHVGEIAEALRLANHPAPDTIAIAATSLGLRISTGQIRTPQSVIRQYAFSRPGCGVERETAALLARLVMHLRHSSGSPELVAGSRGVFHLLVREEVR
jgi:hypothetical protein